MTENDYGSYAETVKRILVPMGLSKLGEGKLAVAAGHARAFGAEVLLLHVLPAQPQAEQVSLAEAQATAYLHSLAAGLRAAGIEAHCLLRRGPVIDTVVAEAEDHQADMVVLGRNVRHGWAGLFAGGVAEGITARLSCPALLVQPDLAESEPPSAVRSFDEDAAHAGPLAPRSLGLRTVAIDRIVGSVGRARELDDSFRPRDRSFGEQQRFERVYHGMRDCVSLPPPNLYKLGYGYYVLDGNHRVAAAKRLGIVELEAEVTEYVPIEDPQTQCVFAERRAFERATGLTRLGAALPGHYPRLEELVCEYATSEGLADLREAACLWEARVYRPLARQIRALELGHHFPDERTADIFLRLAAFRAAEGRLRDREISWEEALARFAESLAG